MVLRVKCPKCATTLGIPNAQPNQVVGCAKCEAKFRLPANLPTESPTPPAAETPDNPKATQPPRKSRPTRRPQAAPRDRKAFKQAAPEKSKKPLYIGITAGAALLLLVILIFAFSGDDPAPKPNENHAKNETPDPSSVSEPAEEKPDLLEKPANAPQPEIKPEPAAAEPTPEPPAPTPDDVPTRLRNGELIFGAGDVADLESCLANDSLRIPALKALTQLGSNAWPASDTICIYLADPSAATAATEALRAIGPQSMDTVYDRTAKHPELRKLASTFFGTFGEEGITFLRKQLNEERPELALDLLALSRSKAASAVPDIFEAMEQLPLRRRAARALILIREGVFEELATRIPDACDAIHASQQPRYQGRVTDRPPVHLVQTWISMIEPFGAERPEEALTILRHALGSFCEDLMLAALETAATIPSEEAMKFVVNEVAVRESYYGHYSRAVVRLGEKGIPLATAAVKNPPTGRVSYPYIPLVDLGKPGIAALIDMLAEHTRETGRPHRYASDILRAIRESETDISDLKSKLLKHLKNDGLYQNYALIGLLDLIPGHEDELAEICLKEMKSDDKNVRLTAISNLPESTKAKRAVPDIIATLHVNANNEHYYARRALKRMGPIAKDATGELLKLLAEPYGNNNLQIPMELAECLARVNPRAALEYADEQISILQSGTLKQRTDAAQMLQAIAPYVKLDSKELLKGLKSATTDDSRGNYERFQQGIATALAFSDPESTEFKAILTQLLRQGKTYGLFMLLDQHEFSHPAILETLLDTSAAGNVNADHYHGRMIARCATEKSYPQIARLLVPEGLAQAASGTLGKGTQAARTAAEVLGSKMVPSLCDLIPDANRDQLKQICLSLTRMGTEAREALPYLYHRLSPEEKELEWILMPAITAAEGPERLTLEIPEMEATSLRPRKPTPPASDTPSPENKTASEKKPSETPKADSIDSHIAALESGDPNRQLDSARALVKLGEAAKPAIPALTKVLTSPDTQIGIAAAQAIGQIGEPDEDAIQALIRLMNHPVLAPDATHALHMLGDFVIPFFATRWDEPAVSELILGYPATSNLPADSLIYGIQKEGPARARAYYVLLNSKVRSARIAEAICTTNFRLSRDSWDALNLQLLETFRPDAAEAILDRACGSPLYADTWGEIVSGFGPETLDLVIARLEGEGKKSGAIAMLGNYPDQADRVVPLLRKLLEEGGQDRTWTLRAIKKLGPAAAPLADELIDIVADPAMQNGSAPDALVALAATGKGERDAVPVIEEWFGSNQDYRVRAAAEALALYGDKSKKALSIFANYLENLPEGRNYRLPISVAEAMCSLGSDGTKRARSVISKGLKNKDEKIVMIYLGQIPTAGENLDDWKELLVDQLDHRNENVRFTAMKQLCTMGGFNDHGRDIVKALEKDKDNPNFVRAVVQDAARSGPLNPGALALLAELMDETNAGQAMYWLEIYNDDLSPLAPLCKELLSTRNAQLAESAFRIYAQSNKPDLEAMKAILNDPTRGAQHRMVIRALLSADTADARAAVIELAKDNRRSRMLGHADSLTTASPEFLKELLDWARTAQPHQQKQVIESLRFAPAARSLMAEIGEYLMSDDNQLRYQANETLKALRLMPAFDISAWAKAQRK